MNSYLSPQDRLEIEWFENHLSDYLNIPRGHPKWSTLMELVGEYADVTYNDMIHQAEKLARLITTEK